MNMVLLLVMLKIFAWIATVVLSLYIVHDVRYQFAYPNVPWVDGAYIARFVALALLILVIAASCGVTG